ncbi:MAG: rubrerythrin [Candidatus Methanoperedens nitroreducens]|uniref:Rubrerythrin n=1 Tax=Candidatus Methanoperedens nitratireducens TaxID=1392998 RepID=A0A0P8AK67_9EURY|nr:rubrerythrin family protein [Candidatus Methanoperedens sp. BLZ2]KAB2948029.1 MAG: rubrerythrin family protein [Candidatus Methanoperedens sp.]KPQ45173.1 MAG: rubrerythrin [Candidatus Methanoperedens sp. BLZ1]MBZ0174610.1 rubrerythrin family protein [Candidatus Methanoperedens nitroreducens]MCX9076930.1 rubrerythrin family protein [Candidatus Methanoperedens sp.]MCX9087470.1 rubrerythrin family protein [Candidatus Methanoperedens sp.]
MISEKKFKGSQTEKNLLAAFAGESQARNRYTYFASAAKNEGYEQISAIFLETADNEKEHAKVFFKHLQGGDVEITAMYPAGVIGKTSENLFAAAEGEKLEWGTLYPGFAKIAEKEGFPEVAESFTEISEVEQFHEMRYRQLINNLKEGSVFKKNKTVKWHCRNCGYIHEGTEAPEVCPACKHAQSYYEVLAQNW